MRAKRASEEIEGRERVASMRIRAGMNNEMRWKQESAHKAPQHPSFLLCCFGSEARSERNRRGKGDGVGSERTDLG